MPERTFERLGDSHPSRRALLVAFLTTAAGSTLLSCASSQPAASVGTTGSSQGASRNASSGAAGAAATGGGTTVVKMNDQFRFVPDSITIAKGATVEWQNTSSSPHTVTDDPSKAQTKDHAQLPSGAQPWDSGMIDPGKSYRLTFTVAGEYTYFCIPHEAMGMVGKITVT